MDNIKQHQKIGEWLKMKREQAGLSKAQMAALIERDKAFVGRYESGQRLDFIQFTNIALALKAKPAEVIALCITDREGES
ncbi:MAG: helix-turn-helix transcriptional regulator [bacterium]|jgi:transcriptional regulator with XRE-family HTH domain